MPMNGWKPFGASFLAKTHNHVITGVIPKHAANSDLLWFMDDVEEKGLTDVWTPDSYDKLNACLTRNMKGGDLKQVSLGRDTKVKGCLTKLTEIIEDLGRTPSIL